MSNETLQASVSYSVGVVGTAIGTLDVSLISTMSELSKHLTIIFGCMIVITRFAYDFTRFARYLRKDRTRDDKSNGK